MTGWVEALGVYDDGSGPALYAGGDFLYAGGVRVEHIARWDGSEWSALDGPTQTGVDDRTLALAAHEDGSGAALYAGGEFTTAGGVHVNRVARWDGSEWSPLSGPADTGMDHAVRALAVYDDGSGAALYAGGDFTIGGGVWVSQVARWDGSEWSTLEGPSGNGVDGSVHALAVYDDGSGTALYAGGVFSTAGGVPVNNIARWDGVSWSELNGPSGTGVDGDVYALAVYDDGNGAALFAGGDFLTAGGVAVNRIARWDGTSWSSLSGPTGIGVGLYPVRVLAAYDGGLGAALYAGGGFPTAGGVLVYRIARWDGTSWSALDGPYGIGADAGVFSLAVYDDDTGAALYAGGRFTSAGGLGSRHIARWTCGPLFADGFESGDAAAWASHTPR